MSEQPTVTRGTAIGASVGTGAVVGISAEAVQWVWAGDYAELPVTLAATIGSLATGALGLLIWLLYWWLAKRGIEPPSSPIGHNEMLFPKDGAE